MRNDIAFVAWVCSILAKADAKLMKQQIFNDLWQPLRIMASFWNLNVSTYFESHIVNWKNLNIFVSCVPSWLWNIFLYKSGSRVIKFTSIQSNLILNQRCYLSYRPWNLNLASFYSYFLQLISNPLNLSWWLVHIILVPSPFTLCSFLPQLLY